MKNMTKLQFLFLGAALLIIIIFFYARTIRNDNNKLERFEEFVIEVLNKGDDVNVGLTIIPDSHKLAYKNDMIKFAVYNNTEEEIEFVDEGFAVSVYSFSDQESTWISSEFLYSPISANVTLHPNEAVQSSEGLISLIPTSEDNQFVYMDNTLTITSLDFNNIQDLEKIMVMISGIGSESDIVYYAVVEIEIGKYSR